MNVQKVAILLLHAFSGWMLCFATIGIGRSVTTMEITLIIHAILAPIFFALYRWCISANSTSPHRGKRQSSSSPLSSRWICSWLPY